MDEEKEQKRKFHISSRTKNIVIFSLCLIILILSFIFDKKIALFMFGLRNPVLDFFMLAVSFASIYAIVIVPTILVFLGNRKDLIKYWFSFALTLCVIIFLKMIIHRERPFQALDLTIIASLIKTSYSMWDFSFPSNHSALSFVALPFLKGKYFFIWLIVTLLIVLSRLYFGLHYLSDALTGIMLSYLISFFVTKYIK